MAYLILADTGPEAAENSNRYYEFDPDNTDALEEIEAALIRREKENRIAEICGASYEKTNNHPMRKTLYGWLRSLFVSYVKPVGRLRRRTLKPTRQIPAISSSYHPGQTRRLSTV